MANEKRDKDEAEDQQDDLSRRFPRMPMAPDVPEPPKIQANLPPHPDKPQPGAVQPGQYNKLALAFTAANSFIMPVLILSIAGFVCDQKFGHSKGLFSILGVVLGLVVGIAGLMRVIKKMAE